MEIIFIWLTAQEGLIASNLIVLADLQSDRIDTKFERLNLKELANLKSQHSFLIKYLCPVC